MFAFRASLRRTPSLRRPWALGLSCAVAATLLWLGAPSPAAAEDDDMMSEYVTQFRENIDQVRIILHDIDKERAAAKRLRRKREALERLSRAYIILQRIPAKVQDAEDMGEARRYMDNNLKDLGADPQIAKAREQILAKAIQVYRAGKLSEALGLFEELRLMDPASPGVTLLVREIGRRLDQQEEGDE